MWLWLMKICTKSILTDNAKGAIQGNLATQVTWWPTLQTMQVGPPDDQILNQSKLATSGEQEEENPAKNCGCQTDQDQDDQPNLGEERTILLRVDFWVCCACGNVFFCLSGPGTTDDWGLFHTFNFDKFGQLHHPQTSNLSIAPIVVLQWWTMALWIDRNIIICVYLINWTLLLPMYAC